MKVSYSSSILHYDNELLKDVLNHPKTSAPITTSWSPVAPVFDVINSSSSLTDQSNEQPPVYNNVSAVYSGPTLVDLQNALSLTMPTSLPINQLSYSRISLLERELSKPDNKYTFKIKGNSVGMADDGYKWRKYGQKFIKNSPNPRSYYKCTNLRCGAKKQVERSIEEPDTLIITYEGLHLHFAYPYFSNSQIGQANPPLKKARKTLVKWHQDDMQTEVGIQESLKRDTEQEKEPQGLLEDMVPLAVRNPFSESMFDVSSSCSSLHTSPIVLITPLNL